MRSLTPTTTMSAPDLMAARKKFLPIRPNPLMPTRTVIVALPEIANAAISAEIDLLAPVCPPEPLGPMPSDRRKVVQPRHFPRSLGLAVYVTVEHQRGEPVARDALDQFL